MRRFETPCPYSWMMIPFSKSPSRMPGWLGCLRTLPVVGPAVIAALIASPSAGVMLATGMVGGGRRHARRSGSAPLPPSYAQRRCAVRAGGARLPRLDDVLAAGVAAGDDRDRVAGRRGRVVGGDAAVPGVEERAGRAGDGRSGREARPARRRTEPRPSTTTWFWAPELVPGPQVHLHPRHAGAGRRLGRRPEVGVVRAAAVRSLGPNVVAAESARRCSWWPGSSRPPRPSRSGRGGRGTCCSCRTGSRRRRRGSSARARSGRRRSRSREPGPPSGLQPKSGASLSSWSR